PRAGAAATGGANTCVCATGAGEAAVWSTCLRWRTTAPTTRAGTNGLDAGGGSTTAMRSGGGGGRGGGRGGAGGGAAAGRGGRPAQVAGGREHAEEGSQEDAEAQRAHSADHPCSPVGQR